MGRRKERGTAPQCRCGCGATVSWQPGKGWGSFKQGHHLRMPGRNPNKGEHLRGDNNPMRRQEVRDKVAAAQRGVPKPGASQVGPANGMWRGGRVLKNGYVYVWTPDGYTPEHQHVMTQHLGRPLRKDEHVHHVNGDPLDNRVANLQVLSPSEHTALHNKAKRKEPPGSPPTCACGCGAVTQESKRKRGVWNLYVHGHRARHVEPV